MIFQVELFLLDLSIENGWKEEWKKYKSISILAAKIL